MLKCYIKRVDVVTKWIKVLYRLQSIRQLFLKEMTAYRIEEKRMFHTQRIQSNDRYKSKVK